MSEFLAASFEVIAIFGLDGILDGAWNRIIGAEDGTLGKFDFTGLVALQGTASKASARLLT